MFFRRSFSYSWLFLMGVVIWISCLPQTSLKEKAVTIAVWDLDDLSPTAGSRPNLGEVLSNQVMETLKKRENYIIVERERLLLALKELQLGTTTLVDESTRLKLGKLVGARRMIFGGYQIIGSQMRLDLRMAEVETGKILKAVQKTTPASDLAGWLEAARKAAEEL